MAIKNHNGQSVTPNQMAKLILANFIEDAMEIGMERFESSFDQEKLPDDKNGYPQYKYNIATEKEMDAIREQIQKRGDALLNYLGNPNPFQK